MSTAINTEQRYMSYRTASTYTGKSEMWLRRRVEAGELRVYRPGGGRTVVFDRLELDAFIHGSSETAD